MTIISAAATTIAGNDRLAFRHTPLFCAVPHTEVLAVLRDTTQRA
jgi:hypothetical protein